MSYSTLSACALAVAALLALTTAPAHAQKATRESSASAPGPRGLLTGTVSPRVQQRADGSQEIESDESMLNTSVVVRRADGTLARYCVPNSEMARRLVAGQRTSFSKSLQELANER